MSVLLVFDLDATFWRTEMYLLDGPPFKESDEPHTILDRRNAPITIDAGSLLALIKYKNQREKVKFAVASRTNYGEWAFECLRKLKIDLEDGNEPVVVETLIDYFQIFPGDKKTHFNNLRKDSGIEFSKMMFFDNEARNTRSVATLGVECVYTPHGMTKKMFDKHLKEREF